MGWQRQRQGKTVQGALEDALARIADHPIEVTCAGRTDTGVHALGQVVHFDSLAQRSAHNWLAGANSALPDDIAVRWVRTVAADFHARFDALSRRYVYLIRNDPVFSALSAGRAFRVQQPLDADAMHVAGQYLVGEHDFSTFRAAGCQSRTAVRHVRRLRVTREHGWVRIDIVANAFLQHMVRNITGTLVKVGCGELSTEAVERLLAAKDRTAAPFAAPAHGLYFLAVEYPEPCGLPALEEDVPMTRLLPL